MNKIFHYIKNHAFQIAIVLVAFLVSREDSLAIPLIAGALSNYGEQFSKNTLKKFYAGAITPVIANTDYEGEIKEAGDRVNVLMFLDDIPLNDYSVGTDMVTTNPVDTEASLIIDQKKYFNFDIDKVDKQFTYVEDEDSTLIENAAKALEKAIDRRLLNVYVEEVRAGNRVPKKERSGKWTYAVGDTGSYVTITTSATVATATLTGARTTGSEDGVGGEGEEYGSFPVDIVGRGIRIDSDLVNSPWYRITTRTSSTVLTFNNWDGSVTGGGQIIEGIMGLANPRKGGDTDPQFDGAGAGYGCSIEGMQSTQVTASNVYALVCELAEALDDDDVPQDNRHMSVPPWFKNVLIRASQLQPDIAMYHEETIVNGRIGRVAGFEMHMVSDDRFSTDLDPLFTVSPVTGSNTGYKILANHIGFITFAHKWSESRVIEAQLQFANLYQGLNLYGFKVLNMRRKCGAYLYGYK